MRGARQPGVASDVRADDAPAIRSVAIVELLPTRNKASTILNTGKRPAREAPS